VASERGHRRGRRSSIFRLVGKKEKGVDFAIRLTHPHAPATLTCVIPERREEKERVLSAEGRTTIRHLHAQGVGVHTIAERLGLACNTVR
jgi:hypothetical protein